MNYSDILKSLNQASAFELYRMRAAINRVLDDIAYTFLHRVIAADAGEQNGIEYWQAD